MGRNTWNGNSQLNRPSYRRDDDDDDDDDDAVADDARPRARVLARDAR